MSENKIRLTLKVEQLNDPITNEIIRDTTKILNLVFNLDEFGKELSKQSFFASNKPSMSTDGMEISGKEVYEDFISKGAITVSVSVRKLRNLIKRYRWRTMGETAPSGTSIVTYTWWLDYINNTELLINYATHIGHELFHTNYFGYIHDPEKGSSAFVNDKDVTYKIDDILEKLIRTHIHSL